MAAPSTPAKLFIGSSAEGRDVAHHLQSVLEQRGVCECEVWDQGVFTPSGYALDDLSEVACRSDFAVLIATPDDVTTSRGETIAAVRDNIILELGLFVGSLGRERTYLLATDREVKLPSDVLGLTRLSYRDGRTDGNLRAAVNDSALQIEKQVKKLGKRKSHGEAADGSRSSDATAMQSEIALLCANAEAQGWTVKTNNQTTLRLRAPGGRAAHTLRKSTPHATRQQLRRFAGELKAYGLRVNSAITQAVETSPF